MHNTFSAGIMPRLFTLDFLKEKILAIPPLQHSGEMFFVATL